MLYINDINFFDQNYYNFYGDTNIQPLPNQHQNPQPTSYEITQCRKNNLSSSTNELYLTPQNIQIFKKYRNLQHAVTTTSGLSALNDSLLLLKHHFYRPDDMGNICKSAIENPSFSYPDVQERLLELVKLCLPCKNYLKQHPALLDELYKAALRSGSYEVASFLNSPNNVIDCPERDAYFIAWYNYEMRKIGMNKDEYFFDFYKGDAVQQNAISKLPLEIRGLLPITWGFFTKNTNITIFTNPPVGYTQLDIAEFIFKYKLCRPVFYGEVQSRKSIWHDSATSLLNYCSGSVHDAAIPLFLCLFKQVFPSQEYRRQHTDQLHEYLSYILLIICHTIGCSNPTLSVKLIKFLKAEGVDIESVSHRSGRSEIAKFLKNHHVEIYREMN